MSQMTDFKNRISTKLEQDRTIPTRSIVDSRMRITDDT